MSLTTPYRVQKLQATLHAKAKDSPTQRFHALYDKVYRKDVLAHAYARCRANKGAPGVDNQTFEDIEEYGLEQWLEELTQELKNQTYKPQAVRRVYYIVSLRRLHITKARGRTFSSDGPQGRH